jgi:hypothetical protein
MPENLWPPKDTMGPRTVPRIEQEPSRLRVTAHLQRTADERHGTVEEHVGPLPPRQFRQGVVDHDQ